MTDLKWSEYDFTKIPFNDIITITVRRKYE